MTRRPGDLGVSTLAFLHSIRFRITLWFILILGLVLAAFSSFIYLAQRRDLQSDAVGNMQEKLSRLQIYFRSAEWQSSNVSPAEVPGSAAPLQKGDIMILADADGALVRTWGATTPDPAALVTDLIAAASQSRGTGVFERQISVTSAGGSVSSSDYLFSLTPVVRADILLGYLVVASPSPLPDQLRRLALSLAFGGLGTLLVAFFGGLWLADRAMRPVKTITQAARSISESDLSRRLNIAGRDELAELAQTFDGMLGRLQAAFDRQRRFLADASHELRTPLTIINMETDRVLSTRHSGEEYRQALKTVDAEGERMSRLVTDLMTLARMDAGQNVLHREDVDLSAVVVEAVDRMASLASRHGVMIEAGGLPELLVRGDSQYLLQMASNLIENAIKYSGRGQTVRVEARLSGPAKASAALLEVSDNGPGIAPEHLAHVFDRFYRADQARSREVDDDALSPSGTGLGLSIVAGIAKAHGGSVQAHSELGSGSTFRVLLPVLSGPTQDAS
jgi:two-component system OmpR family sensor kinase